MKRGQLSMRETRSDASRVNSRAEQTFVGVNVSDTAQDALIEQQSFDSTASRTEAGTKFLQGDIERLRPQVAERLGYLGLPNDQHAPETAAVPKTQLPAIVETEKYVRVR